MVIHQYSFWVAILQKWHILYHVTKTSQPKNQVSYLLIIVIDYMVFIKLLSPIEIPNLQENVGNAL